MIGPNLFLILWDVHFINYGSDRHKIGDSDCALWCDYLLIEKARCYECCTFSLTKSHQNIRISYPGPSLKSWPL